MQFGLILGSILFVALITCSVRCYKCIRFDALKKKLFFAVVADLRKLADDVEAIAEAFGSDEPSAETAKATEPETVTAPPSETKAEAPKPAKKAEKEITKEAVRAILIEASNAGHREEVRDLIHKYGATNASAIDPACFADVMRDAEVLLHATS